MSKLKGKTLFITGASRGIGEAIALRAAADGANVVVAAKTTEAHAKLPGTIYSVAEAVEKAGGKALAVQLDVREEASIQEAVAAAVAKFGGIDILINNASAISLTPTLETPLKRFDLMMSVNMRATFACSQACIPHLAKASNPHILTLSPPLSMKAKWFKDHVAYTMSKFGMSMCTLGMAEEFRESGIAVNSLWPVSVIATSAIAVHFPPQVMQGARKPSIVSDAAYAVITQPARSYTGQFLLDEAVLRQAGVTDFDSYALHPGAKLFGDLYLD